MFRSSEQLRRGLVRSHRILATYERVRTFGARLRDQDRRKGLVWLFIRWTPGRQILAATAAAVVIGLFVWGKSLVRLDQAPYAWSRNAEAMRF